MSNADNSYAARIARKKGELLKSFHAQNPGRSIEQGGNAASPSSAYTATIVGDGLYIRQKEEGGTVAEGCCVTDNNGSIISTENGFIVIGTYQSSPFNIYNTDGTQSPITLSTDGGFQHGFIVKYSPSGFAEWATHVGSNSSLSTNTDTIRRVTQDTDGNIYVIGNYFSLFLNIYSSTDNIIPVYTLTRTGGGPTFSDIFIIKYNRSGIVQWATEIKGATTEFGNNIITDSLNNIYIVGIYNNLPTNIYNAGNLIDAVYTFPVANSGFLVKFNSDGIFQWATRMTGQSGGSVIGLAVDSNNIYVTGTFFPSYIDIYDTNNIQFIRLLNAMTSGSLSDIFIAKYNTEGGLQWATRITGSGAETTTSASINIDSNRNIYISGSFSSTELRIYSANSLTSVILPNFVSSLPPNDAFLVKFNENGNVLWATRISGSNADVAAGITIDTRDNVYICGVYNNPFINIYSTNSSSPIYTLPSTNPIGTNNVFIVKYNSDGIPQFARYIAGQNTPTGIVSISVDSNDNIFITGAYNGSSVNPLTIYDQSNQIISTIPEGTSTTDIYSIKFNSNGYVIYYTRMGGLGVDSATDIIPV